MTPKVYTEACERAAATALDVEGRIYMTATDSKLFYQLAAAMRKAEPRDYLFYAEPGAEPEARRRWFIELPEQQKEG